MAALPNLLQIFVFVSFMVAVSSQSTDWVLSSNVELSNFAMSVQRHPTVSDIAYGARMQSGLDTLQINDDVIRLIGTDAPTDPSYAYYRLHLSTVNHHLYVAAKEGGVIMYDVTTNPSQPSLSATNLHPTSFLPARINDVTTDANYVYAVGYRNGGFFLSVLSHNLGFIVTALPDGYESGYELISVYVIDDSTIATGDNIGRVWTWNIANPLSLSMKGSLPASANSNLGGIYSITSPYNYDGGDILLATHSIDGVLSVNISQSEFTSTVEIDEPAWWIERVGSIGYIANSVSGISIIDLSVLGHFSVIDFAYDATSLAAYGLAVFDNHVLVPNAANGSAAGYVLFTNTNGNTSATSSAPTAATPSPLTIAPSTTSSPTRLSTLSPNSSPTVAPSSGVNITNVSTTHSMTTEFHTTGIQTTTVRYDDISTILFDVQEEKHLDDLDELSDLFQVTAGGFVALCIGIGLLAWIDAKLIRPNDYFEAVAILSMLVQTVDIMSDCFFALEVNIQTNNPELDHEKREWMNLILYTSIAFILIPSILSLFQLYFHAKRHWLNNDYVRSWLAKYSTILLVLSIATGSSFAATSLLNSFVFQIEMFDMGLTAKEIRQFKTQRVYSIVIMENVPQLIIQSYYIYLIQSGTIGDNLIAVSSVMFSLLSIIVSVMSLTLINTINKTQRYVALSMDVTGDCVEERSSKCRTLKKSLKKRVCALIGVQGRMLVIMKPTYVSNGLRVYIRVYCNDTTQSLNYGNVLSEANAKGKLSPMFQKHWNLSDDPEICDIKSEIVDPTQGKTHAQLASSSASTLNKQRATHLNV